MSVAKCGAWAGAGRGAGTALGPGPTPRAETTSVVVARATLVARAGALAPTSVAGVGARAATSVAGVGEAVAQAAAATGQRPAPQRRVVAVFGNGDYGRLGHGDPVPRDVPTLCESLEEEEIRQAACGGAHTVLLADDGSVYCTGLNDNGQLGQPDDTVPSTEIPLLVGGLPILIRFIAAGNHHTLCIDEAGDVWAFGDNSSGQLGIGEAFGDTVWLPHRIDALRGAGVKEVAAGADHSIAVTESGEVFSWGGNTYGQLGHGPVPLFKRLRREVGEYTPRLVSPLRGLKIATVAAGHIHSACVDDEGKLFCFGNGRYFQLGNGSDQDAPSPVLVQLKDRVTAVACGGAHTATVTSTGDVRTWGANQSGCLGRGFGSQDCIPDLAEGLQHHTVEQVACGWKHTAAITEDGKLFSWGWGGAVGVEVDGSSSGGQLGHGDDNDYIVPMLVNPVVLETSDGRTELLSAVQVSCGFNHTAVVLQVKGSSDEP